MSELLKVRVNAAMYEGDGAIGMQVVGDIFPTGPRGSSHRGVLFPLGWQVDPSAYRVEPGTYIVEATLPSGEVLSEQVEVTGAGALVELDAMDSPYETHSWQYVVGNIQPRRGYLKASQSPPRQSRSQAVRSRALPTNGPFGGPFAGQMPVAPRPPARVRRYSFPHGLSYEDANSLHSLAQLHADGTPLQVGGKYEEPLTAPEERAKLYRFHGTWGAESAVARELLAIEAAGQEFLATLPCPWPDNRGGQSVIEVLVNEGNRPTGGRVAVTVRDPSLGGGLAYMGSGALDKAAAVFGDVQDMLFGKMTNPLAAAAAAYVLIGTHPDSGPAPWDPWLENLCSWYPQYSDGAIVWAARLLRLARNDEEVQAVLPILTEAYRRGLPVYTLGLSWLADALSEFPGEDNCAAMLGQVRRLSWRTDMREPFVILRISGADDA